MKTPHKFYMLMLEHFQQVVRIIFRITSNGRPRITSNGRPRISSNSQY